MKGTTMSDGKAVIEPITDEDQAQLVTAAIEDASHRLRMLGLSNCQVAHALIEAGTIGLMVHGSYEHVLTAVSGAVGAFARASSGAGTPGLGPSQH
jgi:hypothetical protein